MLLPLDPQASTFILGFEVGTNFRTEPNTPLNPVKDNQRDNLVGDKHRGVPERFCRSVGLAPYKVPLSVFVSVLVLIG